MPQIVEVALDVHFLPRFPFVVGYIPLIASDTLPASARSLVPFACPASLKPSGFIELRHIVVIAIIQQRGAPFVRANHPFGGL